MSATSGGRQHRKPDLDSERKAAKAAAESVRQRPASPLRVATPRVRCGLLDARRYGTQPAPKRPVIVAISAVSMNRKAGSALGGSGARSYRGGSVPFGNTCSPKRLESCAISAVSTKPLLVTSGGQASSSALSGQASSGSDPMKFDSATSLQPSLSLSQ